MILILATAAAVFLGGIVLGVFTMLVVGIHAEERRALCRDTRRTRTASAANRLLTTRTDDAERVRVPAGR
ncbi:hypothetical protein [Actinomadura atramentaria]|uniref:hypothetical protein n=1 Tax=Actinomadura atramentaria TaxID=1990 RepID=UPI000363C7C8|nr:hypothetical protein [Actinomadura atramentaria]